MTGSKGQLEKRVDALEARTVSQLIIYNSDPAYAQDSSGNRLFDVRPGDYWILVDNMTDKNMKMLLKRISAGSYETWQVECNAGGSGTGTLNVYIEYGLIVSAEDVT